MMGRVADITAVTLGAVALMPSRQHFAGVFRRCYRRALCGGERNPNNSENTQLSVHCVAAIVRVNALQSACGAPARQEKWQWEISGLQFGIAGGKGAAGAP
jgi:hypothetical protein